MAIYDSQTQSKSTRNSRKFRDIDLDFGRNIVTNDVNVVEDVIAVKRSVRNLLSTNNYERPFKPGLGVDLRGMLFELNSTPTDVLKDDIVELIEKFEPRVNVLNIGTTFRGNTLNVTLEFAVINDPRPQELTLSLERVR